MLKNYLKTAFRSITRNLSQTIINVIGLSVGMTCALLIFLWVRNELSYDQWQTKADRIYRLEAEWVIMPPIITDGIKQFPEIESYARFYFWSQPTISYNDKAFNMKNLALVDSTVFKIFNFDFIKGNPASAFDDPSSIVLTKSLARSFFGKEEPIGKTLLYRNKYPLKVTGVVEDILRFHMDISAFVPNQFITKISGNNSFLESSNSNFLVHILLKPNTNSTQVKDKINKFFVDKYKNEEWGHFILRPFKDIYFARGLNHESFVKHGNMNLVYIFSIIGILIIIIACINFINITTAKANTRLKEIAVRKLVGSHRKQLIFQFFLETLLVVIIAHIIAVVLLEFSIPRLNSIINECITINYLSPWFITIAIILVVGMTFLSGFYPSLYLSGFRPISLLKGGSASNNSKSLLRNVLLTSQFAISILLVIATIIIIKQLNYVLNKDLGYNQENVVLFKLKGDILSDDSEKTINSKTAFNLELLKNSNIIGVSYLNQYPGKLSNTWTWQINGKEFSMKIFNADPEIIDVLGIKLIKGRNFDKISRADLEGKMIINETAVKFLGLDDPIGVKINNGEIEIIGVVKDFNVNSLHNKIEPMAISWGYWTSNACVKISGNDVQSTLRYIESVYSKFCPKYPFEYSFLDETFNKQYSAEVKLSKLIVFFALIALFITGLGLFGMSAFMVTRRTKEIGIRKVLGAPEISIYSMFSTSFGKLLIIAFVIASPIAYYLLHEWLSQYPYQTSISWWIFLLALVITIIVTLISIFYQIYKTIKQNPAESLRYE